MPNEGELALLMDDVRLVDFLVVDPSRHSLVEWCLLDAPEHAAVDS